MPFENIYRCPYENKTFFNRKTCEIIESPCCRSNYCKRCCWYRKWVLLQRGTHHHTVVDCYHYYLMLPYKPPIPSAVKKRINHDFWGWMRRKYGKLAYMHTLEQQRGLLHVNYYLMTDKPIDIGAVKACWAKVVKVKANVEVMTSEMGVRSINEGKSHEVGQDREGVIKYILAAYEHDPSTYLPERGRYRKLYFTSNNWDQWIADRCDAALLDKLLGEGGEQPADPGEK